MSFTQKYLLLLQEWELLVLYKMQWELSAITPMDYLDHALPRLDLEQHVDMEELRTRTETILVIAATDYQFSYHSPSVMAASAIFTALQSLSSPDAPEGAKTAFYREIRPRLQAATHTSSVSIFMIHFDYLGPLGPLGPLRTLVTP